jgi:catechol 2,3-dioxygenase-like lactoylglutathione lyase family enzyme
MAAVTRFVFFAMIAPLLRPALAQSPVQAPIAAAPAPASPRAPAAGGPLAFTAIAKVLVRSPDPFRLAQFYAALGFREVSRSANGVNFYLAGDVGVLEILKMDAATRPSGPKTSRTQQGVVAIFEVTDQAGLVERAKAAGATLIERWDASDRPASIYYVGDPENNILGFAARHHDPRVNTP